MGYIWVIFQILKKQPWHFQLSNFHCVLDCFCASEKRKIHPLWHPIKFQCFNIDRLFKEVVLSQPPTAPTRGTCDIDWKFGPLTETRAREDTGWRASRCSSRRSRSWSGRFRRPTPGCKSSRPLWTSWPADLSTTRGRSMLSTRILRLVVSSF